MGAAFLSMGLLSAIGFGIYLGKRKKFKRVILFIYFGSAIGNSIYN